METEAWELCPVRSTFTIHQLRVCDEIYRSLAKKGSWAVHLTLGSNGGGGQFSYQYKTKF